MRLALAAVCVVASALATAGTGTDPTQTLRVRIMPESGRIEGITTLRWSTSGPRPVRLALSPALDLRASDTGTRLQRAGTTHGLSGYVLEPDPDAAAVELRFGGRIAGTDFAAGHIGTRGVFLPPHAAWYPRVPDTRAPTRLEVILPVGWRAVSEGIEERPGVFVLREPLPGLHLVANRFTGVHRATIGPDGRPVSLSVYLRKDDPDLAARYLEATARYLPTFASLLGPYPYAKFDLVESFWESGLGMPSFTLLGPRVLRLPFIIDSSLPHEIAHAWWGNGVLVDARGGNWSEGLTAYVADHLVKEWNGAAPDYRRGVLQAYRSHVAAGAGRDFPLSRFRYRHDRASQAVGYGKGLMLFHMLRRKLGDRAFAAGLRRIAATRRFEHATFDDLRRDFEAVSSRSLAPFFDQWVSRTGAPRLRLDDVRATGRRIELTLRQSAASGVYDLEVPIAVEVVGKPVAEWHTVRLDRPVEAITLELTGEPARVAIDPRFDLFRVLAADEIPPSIGDLTGAPRAVLVMPEGPSAPSPAGVAALTRHLGIDEVIDDRAPPPAGAALWLVGWDNARLPMLGLDVDDARVVLPGQTFHRARGCAVAVARESGARTIGWIGCDPPAALANLARKLPHYGRYGFLGFEGDEARNVLKGEWPVLGSSLVVELDPGLEDRPMRLPARRPLAPRP